MYLHCMLPVLLLHIPPHFPSTSCILNHSASFPTLQHAVKKTNINISFQIHTAAFLWVFSFHLGRTFSLTQGCQIYQRPVTSQARGKLLIIITYIAQWKEEMYHSKSGEDPGRTAINSSIFCLKFFLQTPLTHILRLNWVIIELIFLLWTLNGFLP